MEPLSPKRHIHSSFPHYLYSTPPAPPSSHTISAFVSLCESRLAELDLLDSGTHATPRPPAPRLRYVGRIVNRATRKGSKVRDVDPFVAAAERVASEDAPWCQLSRRRGTTSGCQVASSSRNGSAKCTTVSRCRNKQYNGSVVLACFGFGVLNQD